MNTLSFDKIREKWREILVVLVVLTVCGGIVGHVMINRYQRGYNPKTAVPAQEVFQDLLYLESTENLNLSREQAAALLSPVEKLAADESITDELFKAVYSVLTPQQYMALLNRDTSGGSEVYPGFHDRRKDLRTRGRDVYTSPKQSALGGIVVQMLKAKINEPPPGSQSSAQPPANGGTGAKPQQ
ncbi:MAG: hypothetical protein HPY50_21265 [Firmicutes bacterium]|nr:hypothetical protein [Bacillota bacterium]